jgi:hypothetical protein
VVQSSLADSMASFRAELAASIEAVHDKFVRESLPAVVAR